MKSILSTCYLLLCLFYGLNASADKKTSSEKLPKICMIFDKAGKDDHAFNEAAYKGFQEALSAKLISTESHVVEAKDDNQIEQATRSFSQSYCNLIFAVGVNVAESIKKMSKIFPDQKFVTIDYEVPGKNIRSLLFREDHAGFLAGTIAALKSKSKKIAMIAGMDIPLIERFKMGFEAGAKYVDPKIQVFTSFVGVSVDGWNNPTKAEEIALSLFNQDVDVIFQAAGGSGIGVFNAAEKMDATKSAYKRYAMGADSNQNWMKPGIILTSILKGLSQSIIQTIQDEKNNKFTSGVIENGIGNGGIDWALDKYNINLFSKNDLEKINAIKSGIASSKIIVPDYYKRGQKL